MKTMFKYSSKYNLFLRLSVSIPFLAIILICALIGAIRTWILFLRFGGEHLVYDQNDFATIDKIYQELKQKKDA